MNRAALVTAAALLAVPLLYAFWCRLHSTRARGREWASGALAGAACAAVAGWYYLRNWIELGTPVTVGSSYEGGALLPAGGAWWQEPGYRLVAQLVEFGPGLVRPFDAASHGFWDNYYSTLWADGAMSSMIEFDVIPPWNYAPMLASLWIAIVPTALIAAAFVRAVVASRNPRDELVQLGTIALATGITAALLLYVRLPFYSQGKATYTLGLTPIFGMLAASGCSWVGRSEAVRTALYAVLFAWAVLVLCSYFVV